jgi:hypothetical protein
MATAEATATETLATQGSKAAQEQLQGALRTSYDDLVAAAGQLGIVGDEADTMARKALGVPKNVNIDAWIADHASTTLDGIKGKAEALDGKKVNIEIRETTFLDTVRSDTVVNKSGNNNSSVSEAYATGGRIPGFADGGQLPTTGPGTGMTDGFLGISSAGVPLARVDAGEWIIKRDSSQRYNRELAAINAGTFPKLPGFATGGMFSAQSFGYAPSSTTVQAAAPEVRVFIGNEQIDARIELVAGAVVSSADKQSAYARKGR